MTTPEGVGPAPMFCTTLVKRPVVLEYESEMASRSGRAVVLTVTVALAVACPPGPLQVRV